MGPPGFLAVFSDPGSTATLEEFQDWYDNEHVPLRMNHLRSFQSGARYSAVDGGLPGWLALYEIDDVASFRDPSYTILREKRSERERELISRLGVLDRRTSEALPKWDTGPAEEGKSTGLKPGKPSGFVVTVGIELGEGKAEEGLDEFLEKSKGLNVASWVRTRVVKVFEKGIVGTDGVLKAVDVPDYLGIIEFTEKLDGDWKGELVCPSLELKVIRQWGLYKSYPGISQQ